LKNELADPDDASDAVDIISAYCQEHGRPALIERVARAIRVADASPAAVHRSLCRLPIGVVMTTNFDTLLEDAFRAVSKPCPAIVEEAQLGLTNPFPGPTLFKVHGDISRPTQMVLTEADFDHFHLRNPLLATVVSSHFAQRSVVLVGYSLSDPDLRQLLAMVRERLGEGARAIYSLEIDATPSKIARFSRRHVKVINLPGDPHDPAPTLTALFDGLYEAIGQEAADRLIPKTHESGLAVRAADVRRSCFLSSSVESQADYFEWLGPVSSRLLVPLLTFQDFVSPGDSIPSAIDSMLAASGSAIVEVASNWTHTELGMALNRMGPARVLVIVPRGMESLADTAGVRYMIKPETEDEWAAFADSVEQWWQSVVVPAENGKGGDDWTALVGQIVLLSAEMEMLLGDLLDVPEGERSLGRLLRTAEGLGLVNTRENKVLRDFVNIRNRLAHGQSVPLARQEVASLVVHVRRILDRLAGG